MKSKIIIVAIVAVLTGGGYGLFRYFQPTADITSKKAELTVSAADLTASFEKDASSANGTYTGMVIAVEGQVKAMESPTSIIFGIGDQYIISFQFNEPLSESFETGKTLTIKGQYNGYLEPDAMFDMPGNIQISQCAIIP